MSFSFSRIAARGVEALSLLISPVFLVRRVRPWATLLICQRGQVGPRRKPDGESLERERRGGSKPTALSAEVVEHGNNGAAGGGSRWRDKRQRSCLRLKDSPNLCGIETERLLSDTNDRDHAPPGQPVQRLGIELEYARQLLGSEQLRRTIRCLEDLP